MIGKRSGDRLPAALSALPPRWWPAAWPAWAHPPASRVARHAGQRHREFAAQADAIDADSYGVHLARQYIENSK